MGSVQSIEDQPSGKRLIIDRGTCWPHDGQICEGDSICVSGVCLTVVHCEGGKITFDVISETLGRTTLGQLRAGKNVNFEPSLTARTPISGHFVQGHVEGLGKISHIARPSDDVRMTITVPKELIKYIIPKGSITVDGVSLTVAAMSRYEFEVALIPTTLQCTTLGQVSPGSFVNVETDIISRTVIHSMERMTQDGGLTMEKLRAVGYFEKSRK